MRNKVNRIPVILDTEILVIGGGLAGICAAIQSSRLGCKTILIEKNIVLGGNSSPNAGVHPSGAHRFHSYAAETGIIEELTAEAAWRLAKTYTSGMHYNISLLWDKVLYDKLIEAGVLVLRNHYARKPIISDNKIRQVIVEDIGSYKTRKINVSDSIIEASGDGSIAEKAGAEYSMGRESKYTYNESLAPEVADTITMGSSVVGLIHKNDHPVTFIAPPDTPPFQPGYGGEMKWKKRNDDTCDFFFPTETGGQINTVEDDHYIYEVAVKQIYSAWNYIKNIKYVEEAKNWELVWIGPQLCKRESRRFTGDYVLNQNDVESGNIFPDSIGYGGFALDIHYPRDENPEYVKIVYHSIPPLYSIPYRSIYSKDIDNLFLSSRLMSVSHIAHGTTRLQRTLATVGQAAGAAAFLCKKYNCSPRGIYNKRMIELQQLLLKEDATIIGSVNIDANDKALQANVSASSESYFQVIENSGWERLDKLKGNMLWDWPDKVDRVSFYCRSTNNQPIKMKARIKHYKPDKPYKHADENVKLPFFEHQNEFEWGGDNSISKFKLLAEAESIVYPTEGWVDFLFPETALSSKDPTSDEERFFIELEPHDKIETAFENNQFDYVNRAAFDEEKRSYNVFSSAYLMQMFPRPRYGEAANVINGHNRRYSRNPVNMWISDIRKSLPQNIVLSWEETISINTIQITFDTLYRTYTEMPLDQLKRFSEMCVADYIIEGLIGENWVDLFEVKDNYSRVRRHTLSQEVTVSMLRITVQRVWSTNYSARIYEIRVY